jgi:hypothetical protein
MNPDQQLAHALRMKFKTSYDEPTDEQLTHIKNTLLQIQGRGAVATADDWCSAVTLFCPSAGKYKYAGVDNSDLNTLLALATQAAGG